MRRRDLGFALLIVLVWGANFVAIDKGLAGLPPLLFVAIRFFLTAFPAVFFVRRPHVGWRVVVALGMLMCVGQFGFLFVGMSDGMPAGLASVIMQSQALFTVAIAALVLRERPRPAQLVGLVIAAAGLALIALERGPHVPLRALGLLFAGAACWGCANVISRAARSPKPFSLLIYSAIVAPLPLAILSLLLEGPSRDHRALETITTTEIWSLAYVVILATLVGFGGWYWLLGRYPAGTIAPLALVVPVSGLSSAWIVLGERPTGSQVLGATVAVAGVGLVIVGAARSRQTPVGPEIPPARSQKAPWSMNFESDSPTR